MAVFIAQYSAAERTLILKYKKKDEWTSEKIAALLETEAVAIAFTPGKSIVEFDRIDDAVMKFVQSTQGHISDLLPSTVYIVETYRASRPLG